MGENYRMVPLALIKFPIIENFNAKISKYNEISYKLKSLLKYSTTILKLYL